MSITAILTDIEGTTTDLAFVKDILFPFAARELPAFVRTHQADQQVASLLNDSRQEMQRLDADLEEVIDALLTWIAKDRKITPLKQLQGLIWEHGYTSGELHAHVYPDAYDSLKRWHAQGYGLYVFSSGSVRAQKLLFRYANQGDMSSWFKDYFDTLTGAKREADAYRIIAKHMNVPVAQILFLSDITEELDAAHTAGMQTCQLVRGEVPKNSQHKQVQRFDQIPLGDDT
ncbi:MAG: acireductone synthase [Gammaproteobacteria bacterium]|nr:acireductone synthase [Gammaproteobacteria bacterium]